MTETIVLRPLSKTFWITSYSLRIDLYQIDPKQGIGDYMFTFANISFKVNDECYEG